MGSPIFRAPPPPSAPTTKKKPSPVVVAKESSRSTSTPQGDDPLDHQDVLHSELKERRKRVNPGS